ncbi:MAG: hypothetical protein AB8B83_04555 [Bdellovibrionales bacterium]
MALDNSDTGIALTERLARQTIDANSGSSHSKSSEITVISFGDNFFERHEAKMRKKYLEADLADALQFGQFKSYVLSVFEDFRTQQSNELDQLNNVINKLIEDGGNDHDEILKTLRKARNTLRDSQDDQDDLFNQINNAKKPVDLERAFNELKTQMQDAKRANANWRQLYRNYWTNPGAYLANFEEQNQGRGKKSIDASQLHNCMHADAGKWNKKIKNMLQLKLVGLANVTHDTRAFDAEATNLHDLYGDRLVIEGLQELYRDNPDQAKFRTALTKFNALVTRLHAPANPAP